MRVLLSLTEGLQHAPQTANMNSGVVAQGGMLCMSHSSCLVEAYTGVQCVACEAAVVIEMWLAEACLWTPKEGCVDSYLRCKLFTNCLTYCALHLPQLVHYQPDLVVRISELPALLH